MPVCACLGLAEESKVKAERNGIGVSVSFATGDGSERKGLHPTYPTSLCLLIKFPPYLLLDPTQSN